MQSIEEKLTEPQSLVERQFQARLSNVFAGKISYRERVLNGKDGRWPIGCVRDALVYICTGQLPDLDQDVYLDHLSTRPDGSHWTDAYIKRLNLFANERSLKINDETDPKQIGLVEVLTGIVVFQGMIDDLQPGERIELGNLVTLSNSGGVIELTYVPPSEYWSGSELTNEGMRELTRIALADHLAEISLATPEQTPAAALSLQTAPAQPEAVDDETPADNGQEKPPENRQNGGLTTQEIADVFLGVHFDNKKTFVDSLNSRGWLKKSRISPGQRGGAPATFDPIGVALALWGKVDVRGRQNIKRCFDSPVLNPWKDQWERHLEMFCDD